MLSSLTPARLQEIRNDPRRIGAAFARCREELVRELGPRFAHLSERELQFVFCSVVAHAFAPYGDSTASRLSDLLRSRAMNCGNYGLFTVYLAGEFAGNAADREPRIHFVGWDGGAVGNHQMLFLDRAGHGLVLDPTIGLVADAAFDTVAAGQPVGSDRLVVFHARDQLQDFERRVTAALVGGKFKPSDLLYYFDGLDHLLHHYGDPCAWPTPGDCAYRRRAQPWAAADGLTQLRAAH
jgi:hypothetical protein